MTPASWDGLPGPVDFGIIRTGVCVMGGPGSGNFYHWRRHPAKRTVESCLSLSTRFLVRNRYLAVGVYSSGSVFWGSGPDAPSVSFAVDTLDDDRPALTLTYR